MNESAILRFMVAKLTPMASCLRANFWLSTRNTASALEFSITFLRQVAVFMTLSGSSYWFSKGKTSMA